MRIAFWASAFLLASLAAQAAERAVTASGLSVSAASVGKDAQFSVTSSDGRVRKLSLGRDAAVSRTAKNADVAVIGEVPGQLLIVTDAYPSQAKGLSRCQAGEERFLRVIGLAEGSAREVLSAKVASCLDNLELADPGLTWSASTGTLDVKWLAGPPTERRPASLTLTLTP